MEENLLENRLSALLQPVTPRREFVEGLGNRMHSLSASVRQVPAVTWKFILLMTAGLLSLAVVLALVGRGIFALFSPRPRRAAKSG